MIAFEDIPIPLQTVYAELVEWAWTGDVARIPAAGGALGADEETGRRNLHG